MPIPVVEETAQFMRKGRTRAFRTEDNVEDSDIVVGPNASGTEILVGASLMARPGIHTIRIETDPGGVEVRQNVIEVEVLPPKLPSATSTTPPVILLNGFQLPNPFFLDTCPISEDSTSTFGELANLSSREYLFFDNCKECRNCSIERLGSRLAEWLRSLTYSNGSLVTQVDLVGHSMGGLIIRSYLAGKQEVGGPFAPPPFHKVRKAIFISTPNFGVSLTLSIGTQLGQMSLGSSFIRDLNTWNQGLDDLRGVGAIAIAGNAGSTISGFSGADDGVVSITSQALGLPQADERTRIVGLCHSSGFLFSLWTKCTEPGIAKVDTRAHPTFQIVESFLQGTDTWRFVGNPPSRDAVASRYGGLTVTLRSETDEPITDVTDVRISPSSGLTAYTFGGLGELILSGTTSVQLNSQSMGWVGISPFQVLPGRHQVVAAKSGPALFGVSSAGLSSAGGLSVASGGSITLRGRALGGTNSIVLANSTRLGVISASDTQIIATLPDYINGYVTFSVTDSRGQRARIRTVVAPPLLPKLTASPQELQFASAVGQPGPGPQSIQIGSSGTGPLVWRATTSSSWLTLSQASGSTPSTLQVSVNPSGLSPGDYSGSVRLTTDGGDLITLPVTLRVSPAPQFVISPQSLTFRGTVGVPITSSEAIGITFGGDRSGQFVASGDAPWLDVTPATGAVPGRVVVSLKTSAQSLAAGSYRGTVKIESGTSLITIPVSLELAAAPSLVPVVTGVVNGADFQSTISPGSWISILGKNLSSSTRSWNIGDFKGTALPTSLDSVSATVDGVPAYIAYVSDTQLNVLVPQLANPENPRTVTVRVLTDRGQASGTVALQPAAAAFFSIGSRLVAATNQDGSLSAPQNQFPGSRPSRRGEIISLYLTGLGPTSPAYPSGRTFDSAFQLQSPVSVSIGGIAGAVQYAGLISPGLYQVNVTVPNGAAEGAQPIELLVGAGQNRAPGLIMVGR